MLTSTAAITTAQGTDRPRRPGRPRAGSAACQWPLWPAAPVGMVREGSRTELSWIFFERCAEKANQSTLMTCHTLR